MKKFEDLKIGQHLWVLFQDKIVMVAKFEDDGYQVCGNWECGIDARECKIIKLVNVPRKYRNKKLYYQF
jgi:hypothetical protein